LGAHLGYVHKLTTLRGELKYGKTCCKKKYINRFETLSRGTMLKVDLGGKASTAERPDKDNIKGT